MKKLRDKLENLSAEEINWLIATFVASMLGVLGSELILQIGVEITGEPGWLGRLLISLAATLAYAVAAAGTFYLFVPESRPAFKKIWENIKK